MSRVPIRRDVITGALSAHPLLDHKPFPISSRNIPLIADSCPFCDVNEREILSANNNAYVLDNLYPPYGSQYHSRLILFHEHVTSLESASAEQCQDFFNLWLDQVAEATTPSRRVTATMNVGVTAGSSQPHAHAQVVTTPRSWKPVLTSTADPASLNIDFTLAKNEQLVLSNHHDARVYIASAPSSSGEIRVVATNAAAAATTAQRVLTALTQSYGEKDYNLVLHVGSALVLQILPLFSMKSPFRDYTGCLTNTVNLGAYAKTLRAAW